MQSDPRFFGGTTSPPPAGALYNNGVPAVAPGFDDSLAGRNYHDFPAPLNQVEFQPSETCPKNFVIFDQTYNKSRVMFHPSLAHKFGSPSFNVYGTHAHEAGKSTYRDNEYEEDYSTQYHKEDTEEIDALLSSEEGEEDDVVSTGRTPSYRSGSSPDSSCSSSNGRKAGKMKSTYSHNVPSGSGSNGSNSERKRERMKKMVRTLKGIIPGGDQMDTPAVLDEAVRYLKSLKVEVKKLGVHNSGS
ncbi:Transcription factor bHLH144 [Ananas comosus]|uniref:Transcription factor bHLH144 n=1 Tax=Ananas comosus TaxID=4615 RepID=A0A199W4J5_ANACO|nr:Transcription factor bHLH144 [Ananas comosus]